MQNNLVIQNGVPIPPVNNVGNTQSTLALQLHSIANQLQVGQCVQLPLNIRARSYTKPSFKTRSSVCGLLRKALRLAGKTCVARTTYIGKHKTLTVWCTGYIS